ncbi:MAG: TlpA disulfide reductase family protein [Bacteroidales bacterium]
MKKIALLLMIGLAACQQPAPDHAVITGHVENPSDEEVEVSYMKEFVTNSREQVTVALDEDNRFTATIPLDEPRIVRLQVPRRSVNLYLEPGAETEIQFDADDSSVLPDLQGDFSVENNLLLGYNKEVADNYSRMSVLRKTAEMDPEAFAGYVQDIRQEKTDFLENHDRFDALSPGFVSLMQATIKYETFGLLMEYPMAYEHFHPSGEAPDMPDGYYDFAGDEDLFSDEYTSISAYVNFVDAFLSHKLTESAPEGGYDPDDYYAARFELANEHLTGETKDIALAGAVVSMINFGNFDQAGTYYEHAMDRISSEMYAGIVDNAYQKALALSPGKQAPAFTLTDIDGEEVSLSDFRGQVVYLDFWASWCGPCMQQVPHAKELKERMKDQDDLVFLYISVDTDESAWRSTVADKNIRGVHLNVPGFSHEVPESYNLQGVPTFYLIGRDGQIVDNRPPRPSHDNIDDVLLSALEE